MNLSLQAHELRDYTTNQINTFFPDPNIINLKNCQSAYYLTLERVENCFSHVNSSRYKKDNQTYFSHLYSDHYVMYLWFLSNTIWKEVGDISLATKIYYLNKIMHGFDCMYNTELPDIFLIFHSSGTMLGKAEYSNYFVALQGCTIGSNNGKYPKIGKAVSLTAHSSIIGDCEIGDRVSISSNTSVFEKNIPSDSVVFKNQEKGSLEIKSSNKCYAQQFFETDLKTL